VGCVSNSGTIASNRQNASRTKYNDDISLLIYNTSPKWSIFWMTHPRVGLHNGQFAENLEIFCRILFKVMSTPWMFIEIRDLDPGLLLQLSPNCYKSSQWGGGVERFARSPKNSALTTIFWREQEVTRNAPTEKSQDFLLTIVNSLEDGDEIQALDPRL
jgi:hypothetical protein